MLKDLTDGSSQKRIFCYLRGVHHFDLFFNVCNQNQDVDFFIHSNFITPDEYRKSVLYKLDNVYFVADMSKFKYKLGCFGALITTDAQAASPHEYSLKLISLFNQQHIPVIELQHGLFQMGLHYFDCPKKENIQDDSLPTKSFADYIFTYYPVSDYKNTITIGYPPYQKKEKSYQGEYNLILSNLHWKTYREEEKYNFYKTVLQYAENHPEKTILWKMHHGEIINQETQNMIKNLFMIFPDSEKNIVFCHQNNMLQKVKLSSLISKSGVIISTISTVLLDCEIYHKPVLVYKCPSNECLSVRLKKAALFNNYQELSLLMKTKNILQTGYLYPYNNAVLKECIDKIYQLPDVSKERMLQIMLDDKI